MYNNRKETMMLRRSFFLGLVGVALVSLEARAAEPPAGYRYVYYEGEQAVPVYIDASVVADVSTGLVRITPVTDAKVRSSLSRGAMPTNMADKFAPVFRSTPTGGMRMTLPGGVIVYLRPDWQRPQIDAWFHAQGLSLARAVNEAKNGYLVQAPPGFPSLLLTDRLRGLTDVKSAKPLWWTEVSKR